MKRERETDRHTARQTDSPSREINVARVGFQALRKRQAIWKQPLAEAATRSEPLIDSAARLSQLGGHENALWLTTNKGPECAPLDDMAFRIDARVRLDLPVIQRRLCQHQQRQKSDGTQEPGAWLILTNKGNMRRDASLEETEQSCTMWDITSFPTRAAKQGSNRKERWLFRRSQKRNSRNHGLTWTHGDTQDCRTCASTSQLSMQKLFTTPRSPGLRIGLKIDE